MSARKSPSAALPGRLHLLLPGLLAAAAAAQSNTIPGLDLGLENTYAIRAFVRSGTFPSGRSAIGASSTCCNPGTVAIPFMAAMNPNHGFIHYLVARESGGRLVQISNWSYVKHTFGSENAASSCGSCAGPGRVEYVEVGCADTYLASQAVDHYNLGPPGEVDPWLGTWVPACSLFDRGDPTVAPSQICDSLRSLTHTQANALNNTIHNQMRVRDSELNVAGATYWWQCGYLVPAEADAVRDNNIGSRQFFPTWNGSAWSFTDGPSLQQGSILQRWTGAQLSSNSNGSDDGRFYVAVKVTGPVGGVFHYEYAVHNRDNKRGLGGLRIPICPDSQASNFGFHDVDEDPLNDWTGSKVGAEVVFSGAANPLRWNSIFNFWFDSDAAPAAGAAIGLDQFDAGPGALTVSVLSSGPTGLYNQNLGPGCGNPAAPLLYATGTPNRAALGNATFGLRSVGNPAGVACGFVLSFADGSFLLGPGCTVYSASINMLMGPLMTFSAGDGSAAIPLAVPNEPSLEGTHMDFQMANFQAGGALLGNFNLSNGLRVRLGSAIPGCP